MRRFVTLLALTLAFVLSVTGPLPGLPRPGDATTASAATEIQSLSADPTPPDIRRAGGATRIETAAVIARLAFPAGADIVFIATAGNFPDALAGGPVAGMVGGPILLAWPDTLPAATDAAILEMEPLVVVILGESDVVSDAVADQITATTGVVPVRLAGPDRYATAAEISAAAFSPGLDVVYVTTGTNYPDAVAGGPLAAKNEAPLLLVRPDSIPPATRTELERLAPQSIVVLGGWGAVADAVVDELDGLTTGPVTRLAGADRYLTAIEISRDGFPAGAETVYLATGMNFPDAIAGGPAAFVQGGPVLLTRLECVPTAVVEEIVRLDPTEIVVLGGTGAVGPDAATLMPCGIAGELPPMTVLADPGLRPSQPTMPGEPDRPLAALSDGEGDQLDFVANELMVVGGRWILDQVLAETGGELLESVDAGPLSAHLIRVPPRQAGGAVLADDLRRNDPRVHGELVVNSAETIGLLQTAASLAADGFAVGINPIPVFDELIDRDCAEAPTGSGITGYTPNPFTWTYLNDQGPEIGVTEAWRALDLAGRIPADRIPIVILDGGFDLDAEIPPGSTGFDGAPNGMSCSSGDPCPWHGTNVAATAAGLVDNGRAGAGTGGPVARVVALQMNDTWSTVKSIITSMAVDSDIVSMSWSFRVPWIVKLLTLPFDIIADFATGTMAKTRAFLASAGNKSDDVDAKTCVAWFCWEKARHLPCEQKGVTCVGGLADGVDSRHADSNWGMKDVDIWAPWTVYVGPDPDHTANQAREVGGTSFSTPYVAGVLALILAADPSLNGNEALGILKDTAQWGSGFVVGKYPDAYAAVTTALGGNLPPEFTVFQPTEGLVTGRGQWLPLDAVTSDPDGPTPQVTWWLDGHVLVPPGPGSNSTQHWLTPDNISLGAHTVAATIADGPYQPAITRHFTVENTPPVVEISAPTPMTSVCLSCTLLLRAADPLDPDEPGGRLADEQLTWRRLNGTILAIGPETTITGDQFGGTKGLYLLELRGDDSDGVSISQWVQVEVTEDPEDLPPIVAILAPEHGGTVMADSWDGVGWHKLVTLDGYAVDPEALVPPYIGSAMTYQWTVVQKLGVTQPAPVFIGSPTDLDTVVKLYASPGGAATYAIQLTAMEVDGPWAETEETWFSVYVLE